MKRKLQIVLFLVFSICFAQAGTQQPTNSPFCFMENKGQILDLNGKPRPDIHFMLRSPGMKLFVGGNSLHYQFEKNVSSPEKVTTLNTHSKALPDMSPREQTLYRLDVKLLGSNPSPLIRKEQKQAYYENYYNIPGHAEGILGVSSYEKIVLEDVYPHIDWVLYMKNSKLEYDFVIHPGGDASMIRIQFEGADKMEINADGSLEINTPFGRIKENAPQSFLENGVKTNAPFWLEKNGMDYILSFRVGEYASGQTLTIDPVLEWATYYGGTEAEWCYDLFTDSLGNLYFTGITQSQANISSGGHQNIQAGDYDAMVVKLDTQGNRVWATYYGGLGYDFGMSISVDKKNNVLVTGYTNSATNIAFGGFLNTFQGIQDMFLVKFDSAGIRQWATYYGGNDYDIAFSVCNDLNDNIYIAGHSESKSNIVSSGHQNILSDSSDAVLVKFNAGGQRLWATYYGGSGKDEGYACITDKNDDIYLAGSTSSDTGIASGGYQNSLIAATRTAFLAKFNGNGTRQWATYCGGNGTLGTGEDICSDLSGNIYLSGTTNSTNNISLSGHQNTMNGPLVVFLVKFNSFGTRLWGTYYGGSGYKWNTRVCTNKDENVFLAGATSSLNNIAFKGYQNTFGGPVFDAFVVKFNKKGVRKWGSYFGGPKTEYLHGLATDLNGNFYIGGSTASFSGISYNGFQDSTGGRHDAFIAKFSDFELDLGEDLIICEGDSLLLDPKINSTWRIRWNTGDTTATIIIKTPGTYWAQITRDSSVLIDTVIVNTGSKPLVYIGSDTAFCGAFTHLLDAGKGFESYLWNTGDTTITKLVNQKGLYSVTVSDSNSCANADTILIGQLLLNSYTTRPDTPVCKDIIIYANQPGNAQLKYLWNTGDTTSNIKVSQEGTYWYKVSNTFCSLTDSVRVTFPKPQRFLRDSIFCSDFIYDLHADPKGSKYTWNTGDKSASLKVSSAGTYSVSYRDSSNCQAYDTSFVTRYFKPIVQSRDSACPFVNLSVAGGHSSYQYLWSNGSTSTAITVNTSGKYVLNANNNYCSYKVETQVKKPEINISLGPDTSLCLSASVQLIANEGHKFLWSTGATSQTIDAKEKGEYWLIAMERNCSDTDTISISRDCKISCYVPNAFTPNGDGLNDLFKVSGDNIINLDMQIYNRWGQLIFSETGPDPGWDGKFGGEPCQQETYIYQIMLYGRDKGELFTRELKGDLTLLR